MKKTSTLLLNPKDMEKERKQQIKRINKLFLSPVKDTDKDGVPDILDCDPYDPNKDGVWGWIKSKFSGSKPSAPKPSPKSPVSLSESKLGKALEKSGVSVSKGVKIGGTTITPSGKVTKKGGTYSSGTYTSPTGEKFSMREEEAKKLGAVKLTKEEIEERKLEVATPEQLELGKSIITAYTPLTQEQLKKSKELKRKYEGGKIKKFVSRIGGGIKDVYEHVNFKGVSLPAIKFVEEYKAPKFIEKEVPISQRGGTIQLIQPSIEQLEERKYFEEAAKRKITQEQIETKIKLDAISKEIAYDIAEKIRIDNENKLKESVNKVQQKINSQEISLKQGEQELKRVVKKLNEESVKKFDNLYSSKMKPHVSKAKEILNKKDKEIIAETKRKIDKRDLGLKFAGGVATGLLYSGISAIAPPVGAATGTVFGVQAAGKFSEIKEYAKSYPLSFGTEIGGTILGGIAGGITAGKLKSGKISNAINEAKVKTSSVSLKTESMIKRLKIDSNLKIKLLNELKRGNKVELIETILKGDSKFLPKVKGEFVQVISQNGIVLSRDIIGYIGVKSGRKLYGKWAVEKAIGKLNEGAGYYYGSSFIGEWHVKIKPPFGKIKELWTGKIFKTAEKAREIKKVKKGKLEGGITESFIGLRKQPAKYKGKEIPELLGWAERYVITRNVNELIKAYKSSTPYARGTNFAIRKIIKGRKEKILVKDILTGNSFIVTKATLLKMGLSEGIIKRIGKTSKTVAELKQKPHAYEYGKIEPVKQLKLSKRMIKELDKLPSSDRLYALGQIQAHYRATGKVKSVKQALKPITSTGVFGMITVESALLSAPKMGGGISKAVFGGGVSSLAGLRGKELTRTKVSHLAVLKRKELLKQKEVMRTKYLQGLEQGAFQKTGVAGLLIPKTSQAQKTKQALKFISPISPVPPTVPPFEIKPPIIQFPYRQKIELEKRQRKIKKPKLRTQKRAYQPSVGAVSLGISISPRQAKKLPKTFSGLMLRPMIRKPKARKVRKSKARKLSYPNSINQMFKLTYPKRRKKKKVRKSKTKRKYVRR